MISRKDNFKTEMELTTEKKLDLAWLAGLIDGEGAFSLVYRFKNYAKKYSDGRVYSGIETSLRITMTDFSSMYKAKQILSWVFERDYPISITTRLTSYNKDVFYLSINGLKKLRVILPLLIPYLQGKRKEAELLLEYFSVREAMVGRTIDRSIADPYIVRMKAYHRNKVESSETNMFGTEKVNGRLSEDRVRSMVRAIEELK